MSDTPSADLAPQAVADYLRQHPEFFSKHGELTAELTIPHAQAGTRALSLLEYQIRLLREQNVRLRKQLIQLTAIARDNDRLFEKTRRLVLALLETQNQEEIISTVEDSLRREFQVPFVSLILYAEQPLAVGRSVSVQEARQALGNLIGQELAICGTLRRHELQFIFGGQGPEVGSAAIAALGDFGLLAIGNPEPGHYQSSTGTLFLSYIAEILTRLLSQHRRGTAL